MKRNTVLFLGVLFILVLTGCSRADNAAPAAPAVAPAPEVVVVAPAPAAPASLDGIWTTTFQGEQTSLIFVDSLVIMNAGYFELMDYWYENGEGYIADDYGTYPFTVNNNAMAVYMDGLTLTFYKDPSSPADPAIAGLWDGPYPWALAFVNNIVLIQDDDFDIDWGLFLFANNTGSFTSEYYGYDTNFTVNGNTLTARISAWGYSQTFSFYR